MLSFAEKANQKVLLTNVHSFVCLLSKNFLRVYRCGHELL